MNVEPFDVMILPVVLCFMVAFIINKIVERQTFSINLR